MRLDHKKLEVCEISSQSWKTHRSERHNSPPAPARASAPARKMNQMTMINNGSGVPQFGFEYGGTGERQVQNTYTSGQIASTRAFLYDREDVIAEFSNDTFATVFRRYIHGPGIDEPLAILGDDVGEYTYYLHDGLGSVTGVVDENGKLGAIDYSAFGETRSNTVKIENRYRYTSREFVETNLYYYRARHMRPDLGRFISMYPLKTVDGTNMFGYVGNDPIEFNDPLGLISVIGCGCLTDHMESEFSEACDIIPTIIKDRCKHLKKCLKKICNGEYLRYIVCKNHTDPACEEGSAYVNVFERSQINICIENTTNSTDFTNEIIHELAHTCYIGRDGDPGKPGKHEYNSFGTWTHLNPPYYPDKDPFDCGVPMYP